MIEATARELRAIARASTDAGGYFAALYARVTERIARAIAAGEFDDGARMDRFATTFAGYYLRARTDAGPPRCWRACHDVADRPDLLIVQHLVLGINAHVNHDLALAVVEVAGPGGDVQPVRRDFDAVNDVLAEAYGDILADLDRVSRWANELARLGGEQLFNFSLRAARRQAWAAAECLAGLPDDAARERYRVELDDLVSVVAYLATQPPLVARPLLWLARRLEEPDPAIVTAALLGDR